MIQHNFIRYGRISGKSLHISKVIQQETEKKEQLLLTFDSRRSVPIWDEGSMIMNELLEKQVRK